MSEGLEGRALAHAARGGHVCGGEAALRVFALAALRAASPDVTDVFVFPDETLFQRFPPLPQLPRNDRRL